MGQCIIHNNSGKLYNETGDNTDGAMTQKAVTEILGEITTVLSSVVLPKEKNQGV